MMAIRLPDLGTIPTGPIQFGSKPIGVYIDGTDVIKVLNTLSQIPPVLTDDPGAKLQSGVINWLADLLMSARNVPTEQVVQ